MCSAAGVLVRAVLRCGAAVGTVALLLLARAAPVQATSPARIAAAVAMLRDTAGGVLTSGVNADFLEVVGALRAGGVQVATIPDRDHLHALCGLPLAVTARRPDGPAPGDLLFYTPMPRPAEPAPPQLRVAMFLDPDTLAIDDVAKPGMITIARDDLLGTASSAVRTMLYALPGATAQACRLPPTVWPGGVDDANIAAGHIALADPQKVARDIEWSWMHPRNADPHWFDLLAALSATALHGLISSFATVLGALPGALRAIAVAAWAAFAFEAAWLPGGSLVVAALAAMGGLLGTSFDGSGLFGLLRAGLEWTTGLVFAKVLGAVLAASGLPLLGGLGGLLQSVVDGLAGFAVTVLTGISDGHTMLGEVLLAALTDVFFLGKFGLLARVGVRVMGSAGRVAPEATRALTTLVGQVAGSEYVSMAANSRIAGYVPALVDGGGRVATRTLSFFSGVGDLTVVRPGAIASLLDRLAPGGSARAGALGEVPALVPRGLSVGAADVVSNFTWRTAATPSDLIGHAADLGTWLQRQRAADFGQTQGWLRALAGRIPQARQEQFVQVLTHSAAEGASADLRATAAAFEYAEQGARMHSGGLTLFNLMGGGGGGGAGAGVQPPTAPGEFGTDRGASLGALLASVRAARGAR